MTPIITQPLFSLDGVSAGRDRRGETVSFLPESGGAGRTLGFGQDDDDDDDNHLGVLQKEGEISWAEGMSRRREGAG